MKNKDIVFGVIHEVLADKGSERKTLNASDKLVDDLGLDSMDMATIVAQLEERLDQDPFAAATPTFATAGDFAALYEESAA